MNRKNISPPLSEAEKKVLESFGATEGISFAMTIDDIMRFLDCIPALLDDILAIREEFYPKNESGKWDYSVAPFPWDEAGPRIARILVAREFMSRKERDGWSRWTKPVREIFLMVFTNDLKRVPLDWLRRDVMESIPRPYKFELNRDESGKVSEFWYIESLDGRSNPGDPSVPVRRTQVSREFWAEFRGPSLRESWQFKEAMAKLGNPDLRTRLAWESLYKMLVSDNK